MRDSADVQWRQQQQSCSCAIFTDLPVIQVCLLKSNSTDLPLVCVYSARSWDFMSWLTEGWHIDFYEKAAAVCLFFRGVTLAMDWSTGTPIIKAWATRKKKKVRVRSFGQGC
jgi:hypothetical protein